MAQFYNVMATTDLDESVVLQVTACSAAEAESTAMCLVETGEAGTESNVVVECFACEY
jgi:hypothetical protein